VFGPRCIETEKQNKTSLVSPEILRETGLASWVGNTIDFHSIRQSRVMHPLCRDEFWSWSQVTAPSSECKMCDTGAKSPLEVQKRQNFRKFSS
jgi:hypothetical protein